MAESAAPRKTIDISGTVKVFVKQTHPEEARKFLKWLATVTHEAFGPPTNYHSRCQNERRALQNVKRDVFVKCEYTTIRHSTPVVFEEKGTIFSSECFGVILLVNAQTGRIQEALETVKDIDKRFNFQGFRKTEFLIMLTGWQKTVNSFVRLHPASDNKNSFWSLYHRTLEELGIQSLNNGMHGIVLPSGSLMCIAISPFGANEKLVDELASKYICNLVQRMERVMFEFALKKALFMNRQAENASSTLLEFAPKSSPPKSKIFPKDLEKHHIRRIENWLRKMLTKASKELNIDLENILTVNEAKKLIAQIEMKLRRDHKDGEMKQKNDEEEKENHHHVDRKWARRRRRIKKSTEMRKEPEKASKKNEEEDELWKAFTTEMDEVIRLLDDDVTAGGNAITMKANRRSCQTLNAEMRRLAKKMEFTQLIEEGRDESSKDRLATLEAALDRMGQLNEEMDRRKEPHNTTHCSPKKSRKNVNSDKEKSTSERKYLGEWNSHIGPDVKIKESVEESLGREYSDENLRNSKTLYSTSEEEEEEEEKVKLYKHDLKIQVKKHEFLKKTLKSVYKKEGIPAEKMQIVLNLEFMVKKVPNSKSLRVMMAGMWPHELNKCDHSTTDSDSSHSATELKPLFEILDEMDAEDERDGSSETKRCCKRRDFDER